MMKNLV